MLLYCVRHGNTDWTTEGRYSGTSDPELSATGRRQAQAMADVLSDVPIASAYTSPLVRCYQTSDIICRNHVPKIEANVDARIQEIHYGDWEGRTRDEIRAESPEAFVSWDRDPTAKGPPNGETVAQVVDRVTKFLTEVLKHHDDDEAVLMVSHRTVLRIVVAQVLGMPLKYYRQRLDHDPAAMTLIKLHAPDGGKLLRYNWVP